MTQEQKELLLKLAVRELGYEAYIDSESIEITTEKSFWSTQYIIGIFVKSKQQYKIYGSPKTNEKMLDLIEKNLDVQVNKITIESDTNIKYDKYPYYL